MVHTLPIIQPKANSHDYFCYKMKYLLNCLAVSDEKGQFIDVEVKWPGSVHDARVYANISINKKFSNKEFPSCYRELWPGHVGVSPILLGDPAYPVLPNVMEEFSSCTETKYVLFNNKLRTTRNQIECTFGRLKSRWRILNRVVDLDIYFAVKLVYACFILHNFCECNRVEIQYDVLQEQMEREVLTKVRNELKRPKFFLTRYASVFQIIF